MLRPFGLAAGFVVAVSAAVVDLGAVVVAGLAAAGAVVAVFVAPVVVGVVVDVAGAAGRVVNGVGTGGIGFAKTPAIISLRPASEPLLRNL